MAEQHKIRTRSQQRAVYMSMHADYRMKLKDGTLMVMWFDSGTKLGPIKEMPEDIWQDKLAHAIKKAK